MNRTTFDVVIIGGGPIGATMGLACASLGYRTLIAEKRQCGALGGDRRVLALSEGSRLILHRLGVWHRISKVTPITEIYVSDRGSLGRCRLSASECRVPALGYVTTFNHLHQVVLDAVAQLSLVEIRYGCEARASDPTADDARIILNGDEQISAALVVHAEGGGADSRTKDATIKDYSQSAIVAEAWTDQPHLNRAYERFSEKGPIALLPFEDHFALIWTVPSEDSDDILGLEESEFTGRLTSAFGPWAGTIERVSERACFPLKMRLERRIVEERGVRIGNAAQQLHPVAAQGFNLGLRDVWTLQETLNDSPSDPGDAKILALYERSRRADRTSGVWLTDSMINIFGRSHAIVRASRGAALSALTVFKPLRVSFARRMMFGAR